MVITVSPVVPLPSVRDQVPGPQNLPDRRHVPTGVRTSRLASQARVEDELTARRSEPVPAAVGVSVDVSGETNIRPEPGVQARLQIGGTSQAQLELEKLTWKEASDDFVADIDMNGREDHMPPVRNVLDRRYVPTGARRFKLRPDARVAGSSEFVPTAVGRSVHVLGETRIRPEPGVEARVQIGGTSQAQLELEKLRCKDAANDFVADFDMNGRKVHMLPPGLQGLASRYTIPMAVAIGPYHHGLNHLQQMEKVKQVVAYHFVRDSGHSFEEIYAEVLSVAGHARRLYEDKAVAGMSASEFAIMMLRDGCFLLQYMLLCTTDQKQPSLLWSCFESNQACISNDIMLLENQLPWLVIETLRRCRPVLVEEFVAKMGRTLQPRGDMKRKPFILDGSYAPPHLLGLLRFYKTGGAVSRVTPSVMSKTISATELKEIGMKLTASKTTKFVDMGIKKGLFSSKFFLAPLLLDEIRSCWLVNMAAFELCMLGCTEICSYIAVLAMIMDREEDVHELRSKRLVQGELTNKETLDFFKMLVKHISGGPLYINIMEEVEAYKLNRWMWIKVHKFVYRNFKAIVTVFSIIGVLVGIFKTLLSLKKN